MQYRLPGPYVLALWAFQATTLTPELGARVGAEVRKLNYDALLAVYRAYDAGQDPAAAFARAVHDERRDGLVELVESIDEGLPHLTGVGQMWKDARHVRADILRELEVVYGLAI